MLISRGLAKQMIGRPLRMKTTGRLSWEIVPDKYTQRLMFKPGPGTLWVIDDTDPEGNAVVKLRHEEDVEFLDTPWEDTAALDAEIRRLLE